jgi:hypothetical protein
MAKETKEMRTKLILQMVDKNLPDVNEQVK